MSAVQWTKGRKLGLEALFISDGRARRSNVTTCVVGQLATVYWQTADWLVDQQYAVATGFGEHLRLTEAGWLAGQRLWNVPEPTLRRMMAKANGITKTKQAAS